MSEYTITTTSLKQHITMCPKQLLVQNDLLPYNYLHTSSEEMNCGNPVDIFYFDFAKAFDTLPHSKLMIELKNLNLDQKIVKWIQDYLHDRVQRVIIRGVQSEWLEVYSGVPQGSVIGPILFLIYINEIHDEI